MRKLSVICIVACLNIVPNEVKAQAQYKKIRFSEYHVVGISVGMAHYYGDLSPMKYKISTDFSLTRPNFGVFYMRKFGSRYHLKAEFMFATLRGSDQKSADKTDLTNGIFRYKRNLSFRNYIKELSVVLMVDLFSKTSPYASDRVKWTPYFFVGLAAFLHNPQAVAPSTDLNGNVLAAAGQWVDLQPLGTEGQYASLNPSDANYGNTPYSRFQIAIPFGIGARIKVAKWWDIHVDISLRYTFTDYLDDVSANYIDLGLLNSELSRAMSYRTNEIAFPTSTNSHTYEARDGKSYQVEIGYGMEHPSARRGSKADRDMYMITSLRVSYSITHHHKSKSL